jgi:hypothetical protein
MAQFIGLRWTSVLLVVGLAGCETDLFSDEDSAATLTGPYYTTSGDPPQGVAREGGIDFGQWRTAEPGALGTQFSQQVSERYLVFPSLAAAREDLEANGFGCIAGSQRVEGRPVPDLECRRDVLERRCTWHWIVEVDDASNGISNARGRYEVNCVGGTAP